MTPGLRREPHPLFDIGKGLLVAVAALLASALVTGILTAGVYALYGISETDTSTALVD